MERVKLHVRPPLDGAVHHFLEAKTAEDRPALYLRPDAIDILLPVEVDDRLPAPLLPREGKSSPLERRFIALPITKIADIPAMELRIRLVEEEKCPSIKAIPR